MDSCNGIPGIPANIEHVLDRPKYVENHPLKHGFWVVFRMNRKGFTGIALTSRRWLGKLQVQAYPGDDTHQRELVHRWSRHCKCRADVPLHKSRSQDKWPPSARERRPDSDRSQRFRALKPHCTLSISSFWGTVHKIGTYPNGGTPPHFNRLSPFRVVHAVSLPIFDPRKALNWTVFHEADRFDRDWWWGVLVVCVTIYIYIYTHI